MLSSHQYKCQRYFPVWQLLESQCSVSDYRRLLLFFVCLSPCDYFNLFKYTFVSHLRLESGRTRCATSVLTAANLNRHGVCHIINVIKGTACHQEHPSVSIGLVAQSTSSPINCLSCVIALCCQQMYCTFSKIVPTFFHNANPGSGQQKSVAVHIFLIRYLYSSFLPVISVCSKNYFQVTEFQIIEPVTTE